MASRVAKVRLVGLKPLLKRLKVLPDRVQRRVLRSALTKSAQPVLRDARKRAPLGAGLTPDGRERVHLKKSLVKTRAKLSPKTGSVVVVVGPEKNKAPHSHLVHDGTKPHDITLTEPLVLQNTFLPAGTVIHHPGSQPNPFLADAVDAQAANSQRILQKSIAAGIDKEVRKLQAVK